MLKWKSPWESIPAHEYPITLERLGKFLATHYKPYVKAIHICLARLRKHAANLAVQQRDKDVAELRELIMQEATKFI
ncbi:hypothetical protein [Anaerotruncus rubiinfantis]|uniref:hypothetical protein n=1 Tax=Anaerotruncus rubiinfantis TaxID=1720200 RepID=UPI0008363063|nr:hypothetical protein [Anaerotruncus rubiinfantis]